MSKTADHFDDKTIIVTGAGGGIGRRSNGWVRRRVAPHR